MRKLVFFLIFVWALFYARKSQGAIEYTLTDLSGGRLLFPPDCDPAKSYATAINDNGLIVGYAEPYNRDLGTLQSFCTWPNTPIAYNDGLGCFINDYSIAYGINNSDKVVGIFSTGDYVYGFRTRGFKCPIKPDRDSLGEVQATAINDLDQVAGYYSPDNLSVHAFLTFPNSSPVLPANDLGTLGGTNSYVTAVNNSGQVVGYSDATDNVSVRAFRTRPNQPIDPAIDDIGSFGGIYTSATGINSAGQVIGESTDIDGHGFAFRTGPNLPINPATDNLGTLEGHEIHANGINDLGQVVGWTSTVTGNNAFIFSGSGPMQRLSELVSAPGWILSQATDINNLGQIVGYGYTPQGEIHAFLLTPNSVPEPSTLALLAVAVLAVFWRKIKQRLTRSV